MKKHVLVPIEKYQYLVRCATQGDEGTHDAKSLSEDDIVEMISKRFQHKARVLLQLVKGPIKWDHLGQLVVHGDTIPGSHITDVIR